MEDLMSGKYQFATTAFDNIVAHTEGQGSAQFANYDLVAIGAGSLLLRQGVKIPEHISLAGFGNILVSEHFRVPLTTVRQPLEEMGRTVIDALAQDARDTPEFRFTLIERGSSGPPAQA